MSSEGISPRIGGEGRIGYLKYKQKQYKQTNCRIKILIIGHSKHKAVKEGKVQVIGM